jgi:hypothetical protein
VVGILAARELTRAPRRLERLTVGLATPAHEPQLRRLLRENPMDGDIRVSFEREPDARWGAAVEGFPHATVVVSDPATGAVVGMGSRAVMDVFVNGEAQRVGYLGQLRLDRAYRGRLRPLVEGYALLRAQRAPGEQPYDLTSIVADNTAARRLLEAGLPRLPTYRPLDAFVTLVLPSRRGQSGRATRRTRIVPGSRELLPAIAECLARNGRRFQLARRHSVDTLLASTRTRGLAPEDFLAATTGDRVIGCLAVWDQGAFKQTVVRGYGPRLARWRGLINIAAPLLGTPRLPAPGEALRHAYLSHVAVDEDSREVFEALLAAALTRARDRSIDHVVAGFSERHPLLAVARACGRSREYGSILYAVHGTDGAGAAARLDGRISHVEVALL